MRRTGDAAIPWIGPSLERPSSCEVVAVEEALLVAIVVLRKEISALRAAFHERLAAGAPVKVGAWLELGEVRAQVRDIQGQVDDMSEKVAVLFLSAMSPAMYANLRKLAEPPFGAFTANDGLRRELTHLRDLGYVEVQGIRDLPAEGSELSDHVRVTPTGRDFVRLRESLLARTQPAGSRPSRA